MVEKELPPAGEVVGPWHLLERYDRGTFGVVYRAQRAGHPEAPVVALSVYLPPLTEGAEPLERKVLPPSAMATVLPELEALSLRLVSDDRQARGTAEQLEQEAQALVQRAGPAADEHIRPTPSAVKTDKGAPEHGEPSGEEFSSEEPRSDTEPAPRRPRPSFPPWLSLASAGLLSGLVVSLLGGLFHPAPEAEQAPAPALWIATPDEVAQFYSSDAGIAEQAVASVEDVPRAVLPALPSLGRQMPRTPMTGQRRPPCERGETEIYGACWVEVAREKAPCGETMFDYDGRCFKVSTDAPRPPTSGTP